MTTDNWPEIPRIVVAREWPYFDEDADPDNLATVASDIENLWSRMCGSDGLDDPQFFGPTVTFFIDKTETFDDPDCRFFQKTRVVESYDQWIDPETRGDARIAIANWEYAGTCWDELLLKECWRNVKTYPPPYILAELIRENLIGSHANDAAHILFHKHYEGNQIAIDAMERARRDGILNVRPTLLMFLASLSVEELLPENPRSPRSYEPNERELQMGRVVMEKLRKDGKCISDINSKVFRAVFEGLGYKASKAKTLRIFKAMKQVD